jgi:stage V sporulation protein D (sporulation-specific penicillin-binding protein)
MLSIFLACALLCGRLVYLQLIKGDYYRSKAEVQQLGDTVINAMRGTIYDRNMHVLAQSASVWLVYVNPSKVKETERDLVATGLANILGVDEETVRTKLSRTQNGYERIKGQIEKEEMEAVSKFISENKLSGKVSIDPDTKRYYPFGTFAASVIGFTGTDDVGRYGLEYQYNDTLTGTPGRIITALDGTQNAMPNQYESTYDAVQGSNLALTIDENIQHYLEEALKQSMTDTQATYAYGIVMDVKTGAILGMVSLPDYDLNAPSKLTSEELYAQIQAIENEDERSNALSNARNAQWRNRAISDSYEPGSVFKVVTVSAALEEGLVNENTPYTCTGSITYAGNTYNCWKHGGHGHETLKDLLKNSCNPFAITLAKGLGTDTFYKYFTAFGFTKNTGVDLPGEFYPTSSTYVSKEKFGTPELASYSFGQTFQVSPIQMITAVSAVANGGKLMRPYLVDSVLDAEGNTVKKTEPVTVRQVISESTAKRVVTMMEDVVATGTGRNAFVAGYHVAGKTGTSEKLTSKTEKLYIASFAGFAPANDPEVAVLIVIDEPKGDHGGGAIAAPVACDVFEKVLPYLNVEPQYSETEFQTLFAESPNLVGKSVTEAKNTAANSFKVKVVGGGTTVTRQSPEAGRTISKNGVIVLYTDQTSEAEQTTVPDFNGLTVQAANQRAIDSGLNIKISGASLTSSDIVAYRQSHPKDSKVALGTVVTVYFKTTVGVDDMAE